MSEDPSKQASEASKSDKKPPLPSAEDASKREGQPMPADGTQPDKKDAPNVEEPIVPQQAPDVSSVKDVALSLLRGQSQKDPGYPLGAGTSGWEPPSQPPAFPSQPPAFPSQPPAFPSQPPAFPSQPPAFPSQPSAFPPQPPAFPPPLSAHTESVLGAEPPSTLATIAFLTQHHIDTSPPTVRLIFYQIEQHTGLHRVYVTMGLGGFFALYMIFGYFAQLLCNMVGFAIPAYASMRAIESTSKQDDTKWLTYWVVFACFSCVDFFADSILRYFPFYWLAKIIFLVYCFFPSERNGSVVLYNRLIRPYFLQSQGKVDAAVKNLASAATTGFESALRAAAKSE